MEQHIFNILTSQVARDIINELLEEMKSDNRMEYINNINVFDVSILSSRSHMYYINKLYSRILERIEVEDDIREVLNNIINFTSIDPDNQHEREDIISQLSNHDNAISTARNITDEIMDKIHK